MKNTFAIAIYIIVGFFMFFFGGCRRENSHQVNFYYWKANVQAGDVERDYYNTLGSQKLYIRLFDIDTENGKAVPLGKIKPFRANEAFAGFNKIEFIPVVFITNRTFDQYNDKENIRSLASQVLSLINEMSKYNKIDDYKEIKIDCDWTAGTKNAYFDFLKALGEQSKRDVTCTLRLHQVRDKADTGVPPVRKGYLMCYATSSPTEGMDRNSILDIGLLKGYTKNINDYPLAFDIALPLYSWGVVKNHLGEIRLMNGLTADDLQPPTFRQTGTNTFEVMEDCFLQGMYINSGFTIKIEEITPALLNETKEYLDKKVKNGYDVVYFHLSKGFLSRFSKNDLKNEK
jgi:hypothetical protein